MGLDNAQQKTTEETTKKFNHQNIERKRILHTTKSFKRGLIRMKYKKVIKERIPTKNKLNNGYQTQQQSPYQRHKYIGNNILNEIAGGSPKMDKRKPDKFRSPKEKINYFILIAIRAKIILMGKKKKVI